MSESTEALVKEIRVQNGSPQHIIFVESPPHLPDYFKKHTDRSELDRLGRLTEEGPEPRGYNIGRVPVRYDNGWEIAWDELES